MKTQFCLSIGLAVAMIWASGAGAEKTASTGALPPIVAQICGQANTVIMWHDIDDDGQADFKASYVFKDGKLHQMSKSAVSPKELGSPIRRRR